MKFGLSNKQGEQYEIHNTRTSDSEADGWNSNDLLIFRKDMMIDLGRGSTRVSVQGVKSLGGHFACLCRGFEFYEVKKKFFGYYFSKRKWKYFYTFYHFYNKKSS